MAKTLSVTDPIDFGKYKGVPLLNVPASYLLWCLRKDKITPSVRRYVKFNYDYLLEKEKNEKNKKYKKE